MQFVTVRRLYKDGEKGAAEKKRKRKEHASLVAFFLPSRLFHGIEPAASHCTTVEYRMALSLQRAFSHP
jgi:hypothetical protein